MPSPNADFYNRKLSIQDLEVPYGDRFAASVQLGGSYASGRLLYDYAKTQNWFSEPDDSPLIGGIDQFKEMAESKGVRFNWFEYKPPQNLTVNQAESIIERQRQLSILQENAAAGNSGFFGNAGLFLGHLIGGMTDPLEMLLAVVPTERAVSAARSFGRARTFADQVAIQQARSRAATSLAARTRERFVEGAAGGALNNALFEPAYAYMATALGDDYGVADFAMNIGFGGLFGGGIRSIGGAVGDLRRGLLSRDPDVRQRAQELYQQQFTADVRNFESDPVVQNARMFSEYAGIERAINDASPRARNIVDALVDAAPVLRDLPENVRAGVLSDVSRGIDYADAISSGRAVIDPETGIARTKDGQPINLPEEVKRIGEFISKYENTPSRMALAVREYAADINRAAAIDRTTIPAYQRQEGSGLDAEGINRLRAADDAIARVESMPQTAREQIARTSPDTKNDMLAVALGQVNADRNLAIEAIMGNDPAIRTASQDDIVSQARRSASNEGGTFYDKAAADEMKRSPDMRPVSQDQALNDAYSIMGEAIANAREDIREAYHTFLINEMNAAVVEPGAKTRFTMYRGTQPGTVEGELMRFAMQFKSFPVAMAQLVLGREIYGRGYKSIGDFILHGQGAYGSMVSFMALSTVMGYLAMSIKDMLRGKEPRDPTDPRTFAAAFIQGGGAGIFGDFLFGEYNRTGGSLTATLAGPTLGSADQVANIFARLRDGDDTAAAAFRAMLNNTPYLNLFYARPIMNYVFLNRMQELMNPGSLERTQQSIQRETGQGFWMRPDAMLF